MDRPNVLPFSGERRTDARSYHGREEPRAPARGVAARPALERAAQAFSRCNGLLDSFTPTRRTKCSALECWRHSAGGGPEFFFIRVTEPESNIASPV